MSKLAAFQFYPGDWLKDPALSICSPGARGVWMDVLCLMFESPRRGYLITNHQPWTLEQISEALRGHANANVLFLKELVRNGVMKQDKKRGYFSARLVQDERKRETWRSEKRRQAIQNKGSDSCAHSGQVPAVLHSSSSSSSSKSNSKSSMTTTIDDFKKSFLSKCQDPHGVIAAIVEIVCDRATKSGVAINSEAYITKAVDTFDTQNGQDKEDLQRFLRRAN